MSQLSLELVAPNGRSWVQPTGLFINNEFVASSTGETIVSIDPATELKIAAVSAATSKDVDKAVTAARDAFRSPSWRCMTGPARSALMTKLANLIEDQKELLATIEAWDNGKPYSVALNEDLPDTINTLRYYSGWCDKIHGQTIPTSVDKHAYTLRQPIGVVAQIIPWNYPLSMAAWKLSPALACGNTVVLKAAEQTPLSVLKLGELVKQAGFPPGVINILNGDGKEAGAALVQHLDVDKVAFTGSTATGIQIMRMASSTLKNLTIETGGKSPLLVFEDCDLEQAVRWSHMGIMSNQGQICTATSRILVQKPIYESFVEKFKARLTEVSKIGDQWDESTYQGPQVTQAQCDRILSYIEVGRTEGATVLCGGNKYGEKGYYIQPTVFTDVKDHMRIYQEEIFGPVVTISTFETEAEVLARANSSIFGLGASIFTRDLGRAHRLASEIEAGTVWINSSQDSDYRVPFGGIKQSGIGRELGEAGLEAYTQVKAIHVNLGAKL